MRIIGPGVSHESPCTLQPFRHAENCRLSNNYFHEPPPQPLPFKVWADGYRSRDFEYQQLVYEHLTEAARPLREAIVLASKHSNGTLWKSGDHSPPIEKRFDRLLRNPAELWRAFIDDACESAISYSRCFGRQEIVAFQVAMSHCLQLGVYLNEDELVSWTYVAAKGGHPQAVWVAPLLEASCMSSSADRDYRMVCLAIGACLGSIPSLVALKAADRTMYELTRTAIQLRHRQEFGLKHSIMLLQEFMDAPRIDLSKCSLVEALKSQNVDWARSLLGDHSLDLSNMFDQNGRNALHALTYLEDEDTDGLALLACVHGADLSRFAYLHERTSVMLYRRGIEGTPLQWAAVKGMVQLFGDLMQIHEETGTVITDALPIAMRTAALHHCDILSMLLIQREKTPELFSDGVPFGSNYLLVQAMLGASLTVADTVPLARRLLHGPGSSMAQKNTINFLLSKGANVHGPCYEFDDWTPLSGDHTAISLAISYHDDIALSLLLNHMEASRAETNTLELLNGTLQYCIAQESLKCFEVVLDAFPLLINVSPTTKGLTPLNIAARNQRSDYALALLERGADTSVHHENFSPLARAILDGYLETAEIIYNFCSDTERQQTFGYNSVTGFTMMGRIMSLWYAGRKSKVLIDAMNQTPIWNMVFHRRAFSSAEDGFLDDMMLATLFDIFPEMLNRPDPDGLFPIHRAVRTGHRKAIELLLEKNVNIDAEIVKAGTKVPAVLVGATAFSLAARQLELDPPRDISMGGRLEMRRWRERMKDIMQLLLSKGATIGQNPQLSDLRRFLLATGANGTVITPASQGGDQDDELEWDKDIWPRKLPPDATSLVENQRAGGEHVPIEMKQAMQILNPRSLRQKRKMLPEDEMDDFAQYGQWVIGLAKARREQYIRHGSGHLASSIEEQDVNLLPDSWQRWHACSVVPKSAEEETRGDASRVDELEGAKGKGKMPVDR
ncbi:hypothetical protein BKA63DRAFT_118501 [Paraphoma chrysanthemicola]|nr:hypothetical protein BKA63DRAFT_118501 [Paraphoma chrysanthemicola]